MKYINCLYCFAMLKESYHDNYVYADSDEEKGILCHRCRAFYTEKEFNEIEKKQSKERRRIAV